jgi:hypothetical protein
MSQFFEGITTRCGARQFYPRWLSSAIADRLRKLVRTGTDVTLKRLRAEIDAIERAFPELQLRQGRRAVRRSLEKTASRLTEHQLMSRTER